MKKHGSGDSDGRELTMNMQKIRKKSRGTSRSLIVQEEKICFPGWTAKAYREPVRTLNVIMGTIYFVMALIFFAAWSTEANDDGHTSWITMVSVSQLSILLLGAWLDPGKKTIFTYRVIKLGVEVQRQDDYFKYTGHFCTGFGIFVFVVILTMIAIMPSAIFVIAGAGGTTVVAAIRIMQWKPPKITIDSRAWTGDDLIIINYKERTVVTARQDNSEFGVKLHLNKENISEFITFLKTVLPKAEFREIS